MEKDYSEVIENPMFSDAREICEEVLGKYASGEIGEIYLAYTYFKNTVVHEPKLLKLSRWRSTKLTSNLPLPAL